MKTPEEIKQMIVAGSIGAISLDTSIFGKPDDMRLESGLYGKLETLLPAGIQLILSDVIEGELLGHMEKNAASTEAAFLKALRTAGIDWCIPIAQVEQISGATFGMTPKDMAAKRFIDFKDRIGATIVASKDFVEVGELQSRYFNAEPPFAPKETQKFEFPDALAVLTLDGWAKANKTNVLVVSNDSGWTRYCESSQNLVPVQNLKEALSYFSADGAAQCALLTRKLANNELTDLVSIIEELTQHHAEDMYFYALAESGYSFEEELYGGELQFTTLKESVFVPIKFDAQALTAQIDFRATVSVNGDFTFLVQDGIDKDMHAIGSLSDTADIDIAFSALVTFFLDDSRLFEYDEVEVLGPKTANVDFGSIEPSWKDEEFQ